MNNKTFNQAIGELAKEVADLVVKKQLDYGKNNILNSPVSPEIGVLVRLSDKIARLNNLIGQGKEAKNESIDDTWQDIIGYGLIGLMLQRGEFGLNLDYGNSKSGKKVVIEKIRYFTEGFKVGSRVVFKLAVDEFREKASDFGVITVLSDNYATVRWDKTKVYNVLKLEELYLVVTKEFSSEEEANEDSEKIINRKDALKNVEDALSAEKNVSGVEGSDYKKMKEGAPKWDEKKPKYSSGKLRIGDTVVLKEPVDNWVEKNEHFGVIKSMDGQYIKVEWNNPGLSTETVKKDEVYLVDKFLNK